MKFVYTLKMQQILFKKLFDTQSESKWVELHTELLKQELDEGGDVLEYTSHLKNIVLEF